jgi:hypothetical protein
MRFTIRDMLWLTVLAAVLVAWWVDRGRLAAEVEWLSNPYTQAARQGKRSWIRDVALPLRPLDRRRP